MGLNNRWRTNPFTGVVNSILITEEEHEIEFHPEVNAYGFYADEGIELDPGVPVILVEDNTAQTAFTEIPKTIAPNAGQYRVDYDAEGYFNTGFVNCNSGDVGKNILFTYYGTGTIVHPTFRLQTQFNLAGDLNVEGVIETESGLVVTGPSSMIGSLSVSGVSELNDDLEVNAAVVINLPSSTGDALTVNGDEAHNGEVSFASNVVISGGFVLADSSGAEIDASGKRIQNIAEPESDTDATPYRIPREISEFISPIIYTVPSLSQCLGVAKNSNTVVVVGTGASHVAYSNNYGKSFTSISSGTGNTSWIRVEFGNAVYVAISSAGSPRTMRSLDNGATWSGVAASEANTWQDIAYGNSVFVAVSSDGTNRVMRSTNDGASWSAVAAAEANAWYALTYGNGVFVSVAISGTNRVMRSTNDGASWSAVAAAEANQWVGVAYGGGVFVAVANTGTNRVMRSTNDGASWSAVAAAEANQWLDVVYINGKFIAVSSDGDNRIMISEDLGVTWYLEQAPSAQAWQNGTADGVTAIFVATANSVMRKLVL